MEMANSDIAWKQAVHGEQHVEGELHRRNPYFRSAQLSFPRHLDEDE
jgi:hypothetical protein